MSPRYGKPIFLCGKMAAGKTTLSRKLADEKQAVLLSEDALLETLYGRVDDLVAYVGFSSRLRDALVPVIVSVIQNAVTVVLDFPGNTRRQRVWFRRLIDATGADHELHFLDVPDRVCIRQLRERSRGLAAGTAWTSEADFHAVTAYFEAPEPEEGFHLVRHERRIEGNGDDERAL